MTENYARLIGPLLGYYLACELRRRDDGYYASAELFETPSSAGDPLATIRVGPFKDARFAHMMLVSTVRWQIENRGGECAHLRADYCSAPEAALAA